MRGQILCAVILFASSCSAGQPTGLHALALDPSVQETPTFIRGYLDYTVKEGEGAAFTITRDNKTFYSLHFSTFRAIQTDDMCFTPNKSAAEAQPCSSIAYLPVQFFVRGPPNRTRTRRVFACSLINRKDTSTAIEAENCIVAEGRDFGADMHVQLVNDGYAIPILPDGSLDESSAEFPRSKRRGVWAYSPKLAVPSALRGRQ